MADKKHPFTRTEIAAGLMVILSAVVLIGFIAVIQGLRPPEERVTYYATFSNTIGLKTGADVRFAGMLCGVVSEITPDPEDQTRIRVAAAVTPGTPINAETVATIEQLSLTSERHLELSSGDAEAERLDPGAKVDSVTKSASFVDIPDVTGVTSRVEKLLDQVMDFMGVDEAKQLEEEGKQEFAKLNRVAADVRATLNSGNALVGDIHDVLEEQRPNINDIVTKVKDIEDSAKGLVDDITEMLGENREPLNNTVTGVEGIVDDVAVVVEDLTGELDDLVTTLQSTLKNADGLSANAQDLLDQNRVTIEDILYDLRQTMRNLNEFTRTLKEQPQAVISGKTPTGRKN